MTTTIAMDEVQDAHEKCSPGAQLAAARVEKGYNLDYVAGKLHLRIKIIELIEADNYAQMPEPVFIKGYLRAYANLVELSSEEILTMFNALHISERKLEKALWQSKRESNKNERTLRWITLCIVIAMMVAIGLWWQKKNDVQPLMTAGQEESPLNKSSAFKLTDLSKLHATLNPEEAKASSVVLDEAHSG